jgi:UDP-4-amino-4,6-dideoxy-N-acetyl-beta-L-altrosamine transaminase
MIPYGRQEVTQADVDAVVEVLRSDFLTQGPVVPRFENAVANYCGAEHAVAVNSATSALHIACLALGLGKGDLLWTVPNTFVASANCSRYCGAEVNFVDIDPDTWNLSVACLEEKLVVAKRQGRLPKIVVPVHFAGQPTEQEAIWQLAQTYGFRVIEDASHAIGGTAHGEAVGNCKWSDITVFSFHPVKIVTTGEGGMALTNDPELARRMMSLRSHGITRDTSRFEHSDSGSWYYEQQELGFNYRLTDIQAALGQSQLDRLDIYIDRRNQLAHRYHEKLAGLPIKLPRISPNHLSSFHLYVVRVSSAAHPCTRREVFDALREGGVNANVHYLPVHLQPYYRKLGFAAGQFPEAEAHGREAISLPMYPTLTEVDQDQTIGIMQRMLGDQREN